MKKSSINITLTAIGLFLAIMMVFGSVFAWFSVSDTVMLDGSNLTMIAGEEQEGGSVQIDILGGTTTAAWYDRIVRPGGQLEVKITLTNTNTQANNIKLVASQLTVFYPTGILNQFNENHNKYIDTAMYYQVDNFGTPTESEVFFDIFDANLVTDQVAFFKNFISPFSNALHYQFFTSEGGTITTQQYLSTAPNATPTQLESGVDGIGISPNLPTLTSGTQTIYYFPIPDNMTFNLLNSDGQQLLDVNGDPRTVTSSGGGINLGSEESIEIYMIMRFDPQMYCTFTDTDSQITYRLKNSNPYMWQSIALVFNLHQSATFPTP